MTITRLVGRAERDEACQVAAHLLRGNDYDAVPATDVIRLARWLITGEDVCVTDANISHITAWIEASELESHFTTTPEKENDQ